MKTMDPPADSAVIPCDAAPGGCDAGGVESWKIDDIRRRVARGEVLSDDDSHALVDALTRAQRAASVPPEFVVRVARETSDVDRWTASHPLLRSTSSADHPADALALASVELRRVLGHYDWPEERRWPVRHVERAVADAHASGDGDSDVASSLRWALTELDRVTHEWHDERTGKELRSAAATGDTEAREVLRRENVGRLEAAGVASSTRDWGTDAFGDAVDVGLPLPCLVVAMRAKDARDVEGLRFDPGRPWHALSHRTVPRPMSEYITAVVTPLSLNAESDLALRRLAPRVPTGRTVQAYCTYRDLVAQELTTLDVGALSQNLSPAWIPLPSDAIETLCAGTVDASISLEALVVEEDRARRFLWWPRWELAYVTQYDGDATWW